MLFHLTETPYFDQFKTFAKYTCVLHLYLCNFRRIFLSAMLQLYHNLIVIIQDCKTILCNPTLVMHTMAIHVMFHDDYQCS